jgi:photosystem II stability/assembly factor-like uncharacterized protein
MRKITLIILFFSAPLFSQWFQQNSGTSASLYSLSFADANTGYIIADSNIFLKTTNGGENWVRKNLGLTGIRLEGIYFVSPLTGWIYGYPGVIMKTTNGGNNWVYQINWSHGHDFTSMFFLSELTGWAAGYAILKTTNGGENWFVQDSIYSTFIHFISSDVGFSGGRWGEIIKTTNGGSSWYMVQVFQTAHYSLRFASFPSDSIGWIAGDGFSYKTTNSGESWIPVHFDSVAAHTIYFVNVLTGWYAGQKHYYNGGKIFKTTDSGNNWFQQYSTDSFYTISSFFVNSNTGWVINHNLFIGHNDAILKTTNGGEPIGIKPINNKTPVNFMLYQNYPNPFNPVTKIKFDIPPVGQRHAFDVRLVVYDILGREIAVLVNEKLNPGTFEADWDASNYPSGVYFYKLITDSYSETKKMVLLK